MAHSFVTKKDVPAFISERRILYTISLKKLEVYLIKMLKKYLKIKEKSINLESQYLTKYNYAFLQIFSIGLII